MTIPTSSQQPPVPHAAAAATLRPPVPVSDSKELHSPRMLASYCWCLCWCLCLCFYLCLCCCFYFCSSAGSSTACATSSSKPMPSLFLLVPSQMPLCTPITSAVKRARALEAMTLLTPPVTSRSLCRIAAAPPSPLQGICRLLSACHTKREMGMLVLDNQRRRGELEARSVQ
jgi:hypothetical protein